MSDSSTRSASATVYGYPRQGANRQLKKAIESYWAAGSSAEELLAATRDIRLQRLSDLRAGGLGEIPSNDFSLYDHVLDTAWMLGAIPARHREAVPEVSTDRGRLDRYFAMARGTADVAPLEMTKWFDTNYHYLVSELGPDTRFTLDAAKPLEEFGEAQRTGVVTRPVVLGPVSFLLLAKAEPPLMAGFEPLALLDRVLAFYVDLFAQLRAAGVQWVQLDEPALVTDQPPGVLADVERAYQALTASADRPKLIVASYFDQLGEALPVLAASPVEGLAVDFTGPAAGNLDALAGIGGLPAKRLIAGVVDGRNIWRTDLERSLGTLGTLLGLAGHVDVAASCSLLHVPLDVTVERDLDPHITAWFAFARQKLDELVIFARGMSDGRDAIAGELQVNRSRLAFRAGSPIVRVDSVRARAAAVGENDLRRGSGYEQRHRPQQSRLGLPTLPTTTIGSFPQTPSLRQARAALRSGIFDQEAYDAAMRAEIRHIIDTQTELGLDVLVHGEPERNDMVQYFAEQLCGFLATVHGWVQSYGTRYVRPPIIVGDVWRVPNR